MNTRTVKIEFEMVVDDDRKEILDVSQSMTGNIVWLKVAWSVIGKNIIASIIKDFRQHPEEFCEGITERMILQESKTTMATSIMVIDEDCIDGTINDSEMQSVTKEEDNHDNEWDKYYN